MSKTQNDRYDAIFVGGGVIGLACAWRAARRGMRVCVLERDELGAGATRASAGMLAPVGEALPGEERLLELNLASASLWPEFARELEAESGTQVGYLPSGALHVALDRDEVEQLRHHLHILERHELDAEWLRPSECRELEPGLAPGCAGGVLAPREAAVDPRAVLAALAAGLERAGGILRTDAEVVEAETEGGALRGLVTADGVVHRGVTVVLTMGCWSGRAEWLPAAARPPVRPVKGEIVTLRGDPAHPVCERIIASEHAYLVPRGDGRLIVGATVEERGFDTTVTAGGVHELLREAYRAVPEIAELELLESRAGLRPGTPDNAPLIGPGALEGLLLATGHWRHGVLLAPATAEAVVALLAGEEPPVDLDPFAPSRFSAGSSLREAAPA